MQKGDLSMQRRFGMLILSLAAAAMIVAGCGGGGDAPGIPAGGTDGGADESVDTSGTVRVMLTDAPAANLSEVWVTIAGVELVPEGDGPIIVLDSGELPGQFELLSLAGNPLELGVVEAPAGAYAQVRLILAADGHSVVDAAGNEHLLRVPSGEQTGVKVNFPEAGFVVTEGQTTLLLDFLAAPSVHQAGLSGQWIMRPVIHGSTHDSEELVFGAIEGTVAFEDGTIPQPLNGNPPALFARGGEARSLGEIDPETGEFEIPALLAGDYALMVGWMDERGEIADGRVAFVVEDGLIRQIGVTVEAGSTLSLDLTVRPGEGDDGDVVDGVPAPPAPDGPQPPSPPAGI